jgi:hypothetical protein
MMIAASGASNSVIISDVVLKSAILFDADGVVKTQIYLNSATSREVPTPGLIYSENRKGEWQENCEGKFVVLQELMEEDALMKDNGLLIH